MDASSNVTWHHSAITKTDRQKLLKQKSFTVWFTGLSGSGKSTLSVALEQYLFQQGYLAYRLDGDNIRHGLNGNLDFSPDSRKENIRRIGEVSKLFVDSGVIVITAFISPYQVDRAAVRALLQPGEFVEVYVECSVEACAKRDVKGLYAKAQSGEIQDFTGVNAPYEIPEQPEITINTENHSLEQALQQLVEQLTAQGYLQKL